MKDTEQFTFGDFTFPPAVAVCPFDAKSLDTIVLDRDAENAHITYHCGTTRDIGIDNIQRLAQSNGCALEQLHILRDLDEPGLRQDLENSQQANGLLTEELSVANVTIEELRQEIAALEGGITANRAVGFKLEFGTPVAKG